MNNFSVGKTLLLAGANPNAMEDGGSSPISFQSLVCGFYIDFYRPARFATDRATLFKRDEPVSQTHLFFAAGNGHHGMMKLLLDYKADPKVQDKYGETPLCWAARYGCVTTVKLLLDGGAIPNSIGDSKQAPLL
jgi:hypothetical protein